VSSVAAPAEVAFAGEATVCVGTVCLIVTIVNSFKALVDLSTSKSGASVATHTGAVVVAEGVVAGGVDVAQVDLLEALVDVSAVAVESVASEAIVAGTVVTSGKVGALGIRVTSAVVGGALVNVGAVETVALVAFIACAVEARHKVGAESIDMTSVNVFGTLVDVSAVAERSVAAEAVETGAVMRAVGIGTVSVCITSTKISIALVNVGTVKS